MEENQNNEIVQEETNFKEKEISEEKIEIESIIDDDKMNHYFDDIIEYSEFKNELINNYDYYDFFENEIIDEINEFEISESEININDNNIVDEGKGKINRGEGKSDDKVVNKGEGEIKSITIII